MHDHARLKFLAAVWALLVEALMCAVIAVAAFGEVSTAVCVWVAAGAPLAVSGVVLAVVAVRAEWRRLGGFPF